MKATIFIPELEHFSGSWIVTRESDGSVIGALYKREKVKQLIIKRLENVSSI
ncbi:hypothetical protein ABE137_07390 [Brevibacillus laterosporus]|uniref:hypothetical protein n=1 Tax=Brevibacillus laterosporus TaxID=1465 RepID=UPI003D1931A0